MSSTLPSFAATTPTPNLPSPHPTRDISIKWALISLITIMAIFNIIFAITYLYFVRRPRKQRTRDQGLGMRTITTTTTTGATAQRVTIISRDRMVEIEDNFDPWAYWATDSETDLGHPSRGGMRRAGDAAPSMSTVETANGVTAGVPRAGAEVATNIATKTTASQDLEIAKNSGGAEVAETSTEKATKTPKTVNTITIISKGEPRIHKVNSDPTRFSSRGTEEGHPPHQPAMTHQSN